MEDRPSTWSSAQFHQRVGVVHGSGLADRVAPFANSLQSKFRLAAYYRGEYAEARSHTLPAGLTDSEALLAVLNSASPHRSTDDERRREAVQAAEANVTAYMLAAHALGDSLAALVNFSGLMSPLQEGEVTLPKVSLRAASFPELYTTLRALDDCDAFRYAAAFANRFKHRRLVRVRHTVRVREGGYGVEFEPFSYGGTEYPRRWADDVLEHGHIELIDHMLRCLDALEAALSLPRDQANRE